MGLSESIIIGYILFRVARFFYKPLKLKKLLGLKKVTIDGAVFVIKELSPLDFDEGPLPFTYFEIGSGLDAASQLRKKPDSETLSTEDMARIVENAKLLVEKSLVHSTPGINQKSLFAKGSKGLKIGLSLYKQIIEHNFKLVNKVYKMNRPQVIHIGELCASFGKKPHEHLSNPKKLSVLEKYMMDEFIYNVFLENENAKTKAMENK